jgi:hypothetical protein
MKKLAVALLALGIALPAYMAAQEKPKEEQKQTEKKKKTPKKKKGEKKKEEVKPPAV